MGAVWLLLGFAVAHWAAGLLFHLGAGREEQRRQLAAELRLLLQPSMEEGGNSTPAPLQPPPLLWARARVALGSPGTPLARSLLLSLTLSLCLWGLWLWMGPWGRARAVLGAALLLWPAPVRSVLATPLMALSAALAALLFSPESEEETRRAAAAAAQALAAAEEERKAREREEEARARSLATSDQRAQELSSRREVDNLLVALSGDVSTTDALPREESTRREVKEEEEAGQEQQEQQEQQQDEEEEEDMLPRRGMLQKKDPKGPGWRRRHFVVDEDGTVEYSASASSAPLRRLSLATCEEPEAEPSPLRFRVLDRRDGRVYRLQALAPAARAAWMRSLARAWRRAHFLAARPAPAAPPAQAPAAYGPPAEEARAWAAAGGFLRWPGSCDGTEGAWRYCLLAGGRLLVYASPFSAAPLLALPPPPPPPAPPLLQQSEERPRELSLTSGPECRLHAAELDEALSWAAAAAAPPPLPQHSQPPTREHSTPAAAASAEPEVPSICISGTERRQAPSGSAGGAAQATGGDVADAPAAGRPEHWCAAPDTGRARAATLGSARRPQLSSSAPPMPSPSLASSAVKTTLHKSLAEVREEQSSGKQESTHEAKLPREMDGRAWDGEAVLKEGLLVKRGDRVKNWKKRRFVLTGKALLYYAPDGRRPLGEVALEHCSAARHAMAASRPHVFLLPNRRSGREYFVAASSAAEMAAWVAAINAARDGTARAARAARRAPLVAAQSDVSGMDVSAMRVQRPRGWTVGRAPPSPRAVEEEAALLTLTLDPEPQDSTAAEAQRSGSDELNEEAEGVKEESGGTQCPEEEEVRGGENLLGSLSEGQAVLALELQSSSSDEEGGGRKREAEHGEDSGEEGRPESDFEESEESDEDIGNREEKQEKKEEDTEEHGRVTAREEQLQQAAAAWRPCLSPRRPRACTEEPEGTDDNESAALEAQRTRMGAGSAPVPMSPPMVGAQATSPGGLTEENPWRRAQPRLDGFVLKRKKQRTVSAWKRRYFVLHNGVLKIYRSDEDPGLRPPRRAFDMRNVRVEEGGEREFSFLLEVPADRCTYAIAVETASQLHAWTAALREAALATQQRREEELLSWASVRSHLAPE